MLGDPHALGLDAMFPAAFLALLAPQLRRPGRPPRRSSAPLIAWRWCRHAGRRPGVAALAGVVPGVLVAREGRRVSWPALLALCGVSYGLKAVGPVFAGGRRARAAAAR